MELGSMTITCKVDMQDGTLHIYLRNAGLTVTWRNPLV